MTVTVGDSLGRVLVLIIHAEGRGVSGWVGCVQYAIPQYRGRCLSTSINQLTLSAVEAHAVHDEKKDRAPAVFRESLRVKCLTQRSIGLLAVNGKDPLQKLTLTFFTKLDYIVLH